MENNLKKNNRSLYIKISLAVIITVIFASILIKYGHQIKRFDFNYLKNFIKSYGKFSAVCFILIYSLKPVLFIIPTSVLSVLAGKIFGPYIGLVLSMISVILSSTLAFYLARSLGKPFVDKIIGGKILKLDEDIEKRGFLIMLLMRLSIIFPFDALSYASGLTKIKYRDFILATIIGCLPEMAVYAFAGNNIDHPFSIKFILPIILMIAVAIASFYGFKYHKRKHSEHL